MASDTQTAFDSGPLSSIRAEIGHSLTEARTALDKVRHDSADTVSIQRAISQLHQVTGALSMVGLASAAHLNQELEKLVGTIAQPDSDPAIGAGTQQKIAVLVNATNETIDALGKYLDELIAGAPNRPLKLVKTHVMLNKLRGAQDATEVDLFFPDLTLATPPPDPSELPPPTTVFVDAIREARSIFQSGLLKLLREKDLVRGVREMRRATAAIEALKANSPSRSFWFAAIGFFDAVALDPASAGAMAVQLFGKIDQQIKLLIDGPRDAPEKLFRDVLYVVGKSGARNDHIRLVREIYDLDNLLWLPEAAAENHAAIAKLVGTLRVQVGAQKETFLAVSNKDQSAFAMFTQQAEAIAVAGAQLPNRELAQVLQMLGAVGKHLRKSNALPNETQAIEIATALLFAESSLDAYFQLSAKFPQQVATIGARLKSAMTGVDLQVLEKPVDQFADTMTLRAQTHLLIFQVGREVQINLTAIEGLLDAHFRDVEKTIEQSVVEPLLKQVEGALAMLDLDEAAALAKKLTGQVLSVAQAGKAAQGTDKKIGDSPEANAAVESLTALGLYVAALQQGAADPRAALLPTLIRFGLAKERRATERPRAKQTVEKPVPPPPVLRAAATIVQKHTEGPATPPITVSTTSAQALQEFKRLITAESELKKMISDRNKRIDALELVVANLSEKIKKLTGG